MKKIKILVVEDEGYHASPIARHIASILCKHEIEDDDKKEFSKKFSEIYCFIEPMVYENLSIYADGNMDRAIELLKNNNYSLITLDGNLPEGGHGRKILEKMTDEQRAVTIIISGDYKFINQAESQNIYAIEKGGDTKRALKKVLTSMGLVSE